MADEERYSNRQIERSLDQQTETLKDFFKQELAPVLIQTTKTNGRVTKLEADMNSLKTWRAIQMAFVGLFVLVLIPLIAAYITAHTT